MMCVSSDVLDGMDVKAVGTWLMANTKSLSEIKNNADLTLALVAQFYALKFGAVCPYSTEELADLVMRFKRLKPDTYGRR